MKVDVVAQPARRTQRTKPSGDLLAVPRDGGAPLDGCIVISAGLDRGPAQMRCRMTLDGD
jgi:hypothetical protein